MFLKRLFCKHRMMPYMYMDVRTHGNHYVRKHIWKCTKCGKECGR
nr:MAG TPA: tcix Putative treble-clef, zinc-finger, Zn-binding [Caudoviricetes sp.]DAY48728.1 MAG TPA: tcix Putative treble-clef, zinc-finger, Zn-binding [Caudoviricetes sp.]